MVKSSPTGSRSESEKTFQLITNVPCGDYYRTISHNGSAFLDLYCELMKDFGQIKHFHVNWNKEIDAVSFTKYQFTYRYNIQEKYMVIISRNAEGKVIAKPVEMGNRGFLRWLYVMIGINKEPETYNRAEVDFPEPELPDTTLSPSERIANLLNSRK
jgi:hypothetical protein